MNATTATATTTTTNATKLCRYRIYTESGTRGCKLKTKNSNGFCHVHSDIHSETKSTFLEETPENCPVCLEKFRSNIRALSCGHYCHLSCILKSDKNNCPICRAELPEIVDLTRKDKVFQIEMFNNTTIFEISTGMIASIAIGYQVYTAAMTQREIPVQTLEEFISDSIDANIIQIIAEDVTIEQKNTIVHLLTTMAQDAISNPDQWF